MTKFSSTCLLGGVAPPLGWPKLLGLRKHPFSGYWSLVYAHLVLAEISLGLDLCLTCAALGAWELESLDREGTCTSGTSSPGYPEVTLSEILLSHCHREDVNLLRTFSFVFSYLFSVVLPKVLSTTISSMNPNEPEKPLPSSYLYFPIYRNSLLKTIW